MNQTLKRALLVPVLALGLQQAHGESLVQKISDIFNSNNAIKQRVIYGTNDGYAQDPQSLYNQSIQAAKRFDYETEKRLDVQIIGYGPANNPVFKQATERLTKGIWEDELRNLPRFMAAEQASAGFLVDKAQKLKGQPGKEADVKSLLDQARTFTNLIQQQKQECDNAMSYLGGTK
jgi:hypothetical protein